MKKIILYAAMAVLFLTAFRAQAQQKSYFTVFGGVSIPTGEYANSQYGEFLHENNKAGFAKTGYTVGVDGAWYIQKTNWAIAATVSFQDQGQLNAKNVQALAAGYQDAFGVDQGAVTSTKRCLHLK
jgi:hypothetical protein